MKQFTVKLTFTMTDEQIAAWQKEEQSWGAHSIDDVPADVAEYIADELIPRSKMFQRVTDLISATATKARNRKA